MKAEIEERQFKRFKVLYEIYKESKGSTTKQVKIKELAARHNIKNGFLEEVEDYLHKEQLIRLIADSEVVITHTGKKIVEEVVLNPAERTQLFPAFNEMGI